MRTVKKGEVEVSNSKGERANKYAAYQHHCDPTENDKEEGGKRKSMQKINRTKERGVMRVSLVGSKG